MVIIVSALCGFVVMYIPGVIHFMRSLDKTFAQTMSLCVLPYLPGDAIKAVLCIILSKTLRRTVASFVFGDEPKESAKER